MTKAGLVAALLLAAAAPLLADGNKAEAAAYRRPETVPDVGIGHRWDGKGVFPASFRPPVAVDVKKNLRWKAELPNWGYSAPVPVGNRVLFLCDADARYIWPVLCCYDAKAGQLVWQVEVDPLDAFPDLTAAERKEVTAKVKRLWDDNRACFRAMQPVVAATRQAGADDPLLKEANARLAERGIRVKSFNRSYGTLRYVEYPQEYKTLKDGLWQRYNIQPNLSNQGAGRTGDAFGTPVSDGEKVYVSTIHGTVGAFDIATGRRAWSATIGGGQYREANHFMTSPRLHKDIVIACFDDTNSKVPGVVMAVDKRSGKELWRHVVKGEPLPRFPEGPGGSRPGSSPLVVDVDGTPVCILGTGQAIRLPDGKLYDVKLGTTLVPFAVDEEHDALFAGTSTDGGSCRYRIDLSFAGDELKAELAWVVGCNARSYNVVFHDGRLHWNGYVLDPATGYPFGVAVPETRKDRHRRYGFYDQQRSAPETRQFLLIANGHVYGLHEEKIPPKGGEKRRKGEERKFGMLEVHTVTGKKVSESRLVPEPATDVLRDQGFDEGSYSYSCAMNIGEDALYLVDNRFLYCFGENTAKSEE